MSEREAAAEAARAAGREKATFEVIGRPLTRNRRDLSIGTRIRLSRADADILCAAGRIKAAKGKAKGDVVEDKPEAAPESDQPPPTVGGDEPAAD